MQDSSAAAVATVRHSWAQQRQPYAHHPQAKEPCQHRLQPTVQRHSCNTPRPNQHTPRQHGRESPPDGMAKKCLETARCMARMNLPSEEDANFVVVGSGNLYICELAVVGASLPEPLDPKDFVSEIVCEGSASKSSRLTSEAPLRLVAGGSPPQCSVQVRIALRHDGIPGQASLTRPSTRSPCLGFEAEVALADVFGRFSPGERGELEVGLAPLGSDASRRDSKCSTYSAVLVSPASCPAPSGAKVWLRVKVSGQWSPPAECGTVSTRSGGASPLGANGISYGDASESAAREGSPASAPWQHPSAGGVPEWPSYAFGGHGGSGGAHFRQVDADIHARDSRTDELETEAREARLRHAAATATHDGPPASAGVVTPRILFGGGAESCSSSVEADGARGVAIDQDGGGAGTATGESEIGSMPWESQQSLQEAGPYYSSKEDPGPPGEWRQVSVGTAVIGCTSAT